MKEEKTNGHKELDILFEYSLDIKGRIIYYTGDIDEEMVDGCIKCLNYLDSNGKGEITLKICSYGGSIDFMFALYDAIVSCKNPVHTVGTGAICSAAVLLLACGNKRSSTGNAWGMGHRAEGFGVGNVDQMSSQVDAFKRYEKQRYVLLEKHTNWSASQWKKREKEKGEVWMNPEEMLEAGVVDAIIKPSIPRRKNARRKRA